MKIAFMGAGSSIFARNVIGDCLCTDSLRDAEFALYDIDSVRLAESLDMLQSINRGDAVFKTYCGVENRKAALCGASFVINAIQVGGYDPCTKIDFEIPRRYGLLQTIGDTLGIGGIMRALRTIPVMEGFARDMSEVGPNALFLNYTNPMAMLSGYMQRFTGIKTVGLCHSVQVCARALLSQIGMESELAGARTLIAGINHMAWLLEIYDRDGKDLYPEIRARAKKKLAGEKFNDMVRFDYIDKFGYYCTESSEHNAEYNPFYIKSKYPELVEKFNIPIDEYLRRCIRNINSWKAGIGEHTERTSEYASYIMEAVVENKPFEIGGNVINDSLIDNLPSDACVEVPCLVNGRGVSPCHVGRLPTALAAMNMTNINVQLLTIEAAVTKKRELIYQAAMLDPHTASELSTDDIVSMVDELISAHGDYLPKYN